MRFRVWMLCVLYFVVAFPACSADKAVPENPELTWKVFLEKAPTDNELASIVIHAADDYFRKAAFNELIKRNAYYYTLIFEKIFYESTEPYRSLAWTRLKTVKSVAFFAQMLGEAPQSHKKEIWEHFKNLEPEPWYLRDVIGRAPEPYKKLAWELLLQKYTLPDDLLPTVWHDDVPQPYRDLTAQELLKRFPDLSQEHLTGMFLGISQKMEQKLWDRFIATQPNHDALRALIGVVYLEPSGVPDENSYCKHYSDTIKLRAARRLLEDGPFWIDLNAIRICAPEPHRGTASLLWSLMQRPKEELLEDILKSKE